MPVLLDFLLPGRAPAASEVVCVIPAADANRSTDVVVGELAAADDAPYGLDGEAKALCDRSEVMQLVSGGWRRGVALRSERSVKRGISGHPHLRAEHAHGASP